jgi:hypothetical protein
MDSRNSLWGSWPVHIDMAGEASISHHQTDITDVRDEHSLKDNKVERLDPEEDYEQRMHSVALDEAQAREEKIGIWSDSMKADREEEGYR